ncbi:MAG TPA: hypothetical protein ENK76_02450 [Campylobacterales bacterium]|nr:hypothetical protein [Campylobacterales bacterium]
MSVIKEYESIYEIFNQYAKEFQNNPKTTKQIDPKFINIEKESIKTEQSNLNPKIDKLMENWNKLISKLENIKAPNQIQESAKSVKKDLIDHLKSIQKPKQKFDQERRNQVLEQLKQGKEKNRGVQR